MITGVLIGSSTLPSFPGRRRPFNRKGSPEIFFARIFKTISWSLATSSLSNLKSTSIGFECFLSSPAKEFGEERNKRPRARMRRVFIQSITVAGQSISVARLRVSPSFLDVSSGQLRPPERCWLDTGAPLSVIPFHVHNQQLTWQPLGSRTTWVGQPCELGRIDVWFRTQAGSSPRGPLSLLAKFPDSDPPGHPVPILLGLEFLVSYQAFFALPPPPRKGGIWIP